MKRKPTGHQNPKWEPIGLDEWRVSDDKIRSRIDTAGLTRVAADAGVRSPDNFVDKALNIASVLWVDLHYEGRPTVPSRRKELQNVLKAAKVLKGALNSLGADARKDLSGELSRAKEAPPAKKKQREKQKAEGFSILVRWMTDHLAQVGGSVRAPDGCIYTDPMALAEAFVESGLTLTEFIGGDQYVLSAGALRREEHEHFPPDEFNSAVACVEKIENGATLAIKALPEPQMGRKREEAIRRAIVDLRTAWVEATGKEPKLTYDKRTKATRGGIIDFVNMLLQPVMNEYGKPTSFEDYVREALYGNKPSRPR